MTNGTKVFPVVRWHEPAIDWARVDMKRFAATRDPSLLRYLDGEKPTVFHCRPLSRQEIREVHNQPHDAGKYELAFRYGLVTVDHLESLTEPGVFRDFVKPDDDSGKAKLLPDHVVEKYFAEVDVQEVGSIIWHRSFLVRPSARIYPLLAMSQSAAQANLYHRAAQMSDSQSSAQSKQPHEAQPAATPQPSHVGAESTGVIATAAAI